MKKRVLAWMLVLVMTVAMFAGCSNTPADPTDGTQSSTQDGTDATNGSETGEKVTITLKTALGPDASEADKEVHDLFLKGVAEHFPNVELIEIVDVPTGNYRQQHDQELLSGTAPTASKNLPACDIPTRIRNGTVADITDIVNEWAMMQDGLVWDQVNSSLQDEDGHWYAVPFSSGINGSMFNKKAIEAAGKDPADIPMSWDGFADLCQELSTEDKSRFGYEIVGKEWCAWPFTLWVFSAGGQMVEKNADGTYRICFNEAPAVDAAMYLNSLIWEKNATQKDVLQDWSQNNNDVRTGKACFAFTSPFQFTNQNLEQYGLSIDDFGFTGVPSKDGSRMYALLGANVITVNPKATPEQQKAAFEVLAYTVYDEEYLKGVWEIEKKYGLTDAFMPVRTDMIELHNEIFDEPLNQQTIAAYAYGIPEPDCPNWNELKNELVIPLQKIYLDKDLTREEAQKILDDCAELLYQKYPRSFSKGG